MKSILTMPTPEQDRTTNGAQSTPQNTAPLPDVRHRLLQQIQHADALAPPETSQNTPQAKTSWSEVAKILNP